MDTYEKLANAIVIRAADDYRSARRKLKRNPRNQLALAEKDEIERFFLSSWIKVLTKANGGMILRKLKEERL